MVDLVNETASSVEQAQVSHHDKPCRSSVGVGKTQEMLLAFPQEPKVPFPRRS